MADAKECPHCIDPPHFKKPCDWGAVVIKIGRLKERVETYKDSVKYHQEKCIEFSNELTATKDELGAALNHIKILEERVNKSFSVHAAETMEEWAELIEKMKKALELVGDRAHCGAKAGPNIEGGLVNLLMKIDAECNEILAKIRHS